MDTSRAEAVRLGLAHTLGVLVVVAAGNGVIALVIWNTATLGERHYWMPLVLAVPVSVFVGLLCWRMGPVPLAAGVVGSLTVSALLVAFFTDRAVEWQWKRSESDATAIARRVLDDAHGVPGCTARVVWLPVFGNTDQVCVTIYLGSEFFPAGATVSFERRISDREYRAVVFQTAQGSPLEPDNCIRELGDGWWEVASDEWHCPRGFEIQPGG
jgi:hypothetical protein